MTIARAPQFILAKSSPNTLFLAKHVHVRQQYLQAGMKLAGVGCYCNLFCASGIFSRTCFVFVSIREKVTSNEGSVELLNSFT